MDIDQPSIADIRRALIAQPGEAFDLAERPQKDEVFFEDNDAADRSLAIDAEAIEDLRGRLYADKKNALLLVLQGIDTAGKSSTTRAVFSRCSPLGIETTAFKKPTPRESLHDFLWRVHRAVPRRGWIGIFDRSHYEDVLIAKVRGFAQPEKIEQRYGHINAFEKILSDHGTVIIKCMLNISHKEQGERLRSRLDKPHKRWKFHPGDLEDRKLWGDYMNAYEQAVKRCSTAHAPWYVIPSDSRPRRNALVARLVRGALEEIDPQYPDPGYRPGDFDID